jgi:hypothetical protein
MNKSRKPLNLDVKKEIGRYILDKKRRTKIHSSIQRAHCIQRTGKHKYKSIEISSFLNIFWSLTLIISINKIDISFEKLKFNNY